MQRLRAFKKIALKAGEEQTVSFTVTKDDLAFVNAELKTGDGERSLKYDR